jgi:hypothetical protein
VEALFLAQGSLSALVSGYSCRIPNKIIRLVSTLEKNDKILMRVPEGILGIKETDAVKAFLQFTHFAEAIVVRNDPL